MSDHEIRKLLATMAEDVQDVRPLARKALRRTRTRRGAVATAAVASVTALAFAGTSLALNAGGVENERVVSPAAPDGTPAPPNEMRGDIVAYGRTDDGGEWWLSAYQSDAEELCVVLQHGTGDMNENCRRYDPEGVGLAKDPDYSSGPQNLFGWVPADVAKLWVTWGGEYVDEGPEDEPEAGEDDSPDDESGAGDPAGAPGEHPSQGPNTDITIEGEEEVRLYDAPEGFPLPVRFFALVPGPDHAEAIRFWTRSGDATVVIMSTPDQTEEPRSNG
jgi:hypothetical protein